MSGAQANSVVTPFSQSQDANGKNPGYAKAVTLSSLQESALITYGFTAQQQLWSQFQIRAALEAIDRSYMREVDYTTEQWRARLANKGGDPTKFQNIQVPVVMPQVQAALGYFTNVFLTGYPIFGVGSDPSVIDAATQMETIIAENSKTAGWARQLMLFFRDGLKYNLHAVEVQWEQKTIANIVNNIAKPVNSGEVKEVIWAGNTIRRMDMYNTFYDPRVHPAEISEKGDFAGYVELLTRTQLKSEINNLFGIVDKATAIRALESGYGEGSGANSSGLTPYAYYIPMVNPEPLMATQNQQVFDWMSWATAALPNNRQGIRYSNVYTKTTLYGRIIPADFGFNVPGANTPQVWKFRIINGSVVLTAERLSYAHNFIPIFFGQPLEDGLDYQTKSFASNVQPMQEVASAMINGYVASKRRLVGDRVLYDPMRVSAEAINSDNPAAKIPVRSASFGKPVGESVYAFPYRDDNTLGFVQASKMIMEYANLINGQNPAQQGQFVKGNKTLHEYDDVMGHGNAVNQMMAIMMEAQVFTPMKEVIKLNMLQFQKPGIIYNDQLKKEITIDLVTLRNAAVQFKVSDGIIPKDKLLSGDDWTTAMQTLTSAPSLGAAYNLGPMFSYLMKLRGADITPFEKSPQQQQYEQQLGVWQQAAEMAAKAGAPFSTPMPQPPPPQPPTESPKVAALASTQTPTPGARSNA